MTRIVTIPAGFPVVPNELSSKRRYRALSRVFRQFDGVAVFGMAIDGVNDDPRLDGPFTPAY